MKVTCTQGPVTTITSGAITPPTPVRMAVGGMVYGREPEL